MTEGNHTKPIIGITIGDPAGIGPEISLKALAHGNMDRIATSVLIGDRKILERCIVEFGIDLELKEFKEIDRDNVDLSNEPAGSSNERPAAYMIDLKNLPRDLVWGEGTDETGRAAGENIIHAVELWKHGKIDAITTAPINKHTLAMGGYDYPGHTEFIAELTDTKQFAMSFFADKLRVVLVSTHVPLVTAIKLVTTEKLIELATFTDRTLSKLLKRPISIAVAGINPHASENGMFGTEEAEIIIPAVEHCRDNLGLDIHGPFSPDTIFLRGFRGEFDAVIACYHDQATIAVKSLSFGSGVNVTLGLPLIRTSVDHGTAFDIAGKGIADESSMKTAIKLAAELAILNAES